MMLQGIFLADGASDLPLARHLERICADAGRAVALTPIDPRHLSGVGHTVFGRLEFLVDQGVSVDIVFVHRDAEGQDPSFRRAEVASAARDSRVEVPVVPVVPVRMTEAWLLLDEGAIRTVAGRPSGRGALGLPSRRDVERIANPKAALAETLLQASELSGRRRSQFSRDFARHRALLLERLDASGPVRELAAWRQLVEDTELALRDQSS